MSFHLFSTKEEDDDDDEDDVWGMMMMMDNNNNGGELEDSSSRSQHHNNNNESFDIGSSRSTHHQEEEEGPNRLHHVLQSTIQSMYGQKEEDSLEESMNQLQQIQGVIMAGNHNIPYMDINGNTNNDDETTTTTSNSTWQLEVDSMILQAKRYLIERTMGTMALCRGTNGIRLYRAGAIQSLLSLLFALLLPKEESKTTINDNDNDAAYDNNNDNNNNNNNCQIRTFQYDISSSLPVIPSNDHHNIPNNFIQHETKENINFEDWNCQTTKDDDDDDQQQYHQQNLRLKQNKYLEALDLAIASMGALRDLVCGNATNRSAILDFQISSSSDNNNNQSCKTTGIQIISNYIKRYKYLTWQQILSLSNDNNNNHHLLDNNHTSNLSDTTITSRGKKELRLFTNVVGVIRNSTHSTKTNCDAFYNEGICELLIWRLKYGAVVAAKNKSSQIIPKNNNDDDDDNSNSPSRHSTTSTIDAATTTATWTEIMARPPKLPITTDPWREVCYRISSSLINMAEKSQKCAHTCGTDISLLYLLIESWGGFCLLSESPSSSSSNRLVSTVETTTTTTTTTKSKLKTTPMLHLGLAAILHVAQDHLTKNLIETNNNNNHHNQYPNNNNSSMTKNDGSSNPHPTTIITMMMSFLNSITCILEKEEARKRFAQKKEIKRKEILARKQQLTRAN